MHSGCGRPYPDIIVVPELFVHDQKSYHICLVPQTSSDTFAGPHLSHEVRLMVLEFMTYQTLGRDPGFENMRYILTFKYNTYFRNCATYMRQNVFQHLKEIQW
jgi:hypothetical protein